MIESGILFLTVLIFIIGIITSIENKFKWKIFDILPSIVIIYALVMILSSLGLWSKNEDIDSVYSSFKKHPASKHDISYAFRSRYQNHSQAW